MIGNPNENSSMTFLNSSVVGNEEKNKILNITDNNIISKETNEEWEKKLEKKSYKPIAIDKYLSSRSNLTKEINSNVSLKDVAVTEFKEENEAND